MEIGAAIFFTDYSMAPTEVAVALEERGFDCPLLDIGVDPRR